MTAMYNVGKAITLSYQCHGEIQTLPVFPLVSDETYYLQNKQKTNLVPIFYWDC